jgi:hypothetical protein
MSSATKLAAAVRVKTVITIANDLLSLVMIMPPYCSIFPLFHYSIGYFRMP